MITLEKLDYLLPLSLLLFAVLFAPEWSAYLELWYTSIIYSHGYLVLALSLYLIWKQWPRLKASTLAPSWLGFAALTSFCLVLLLAKAADIKTITLVMVPFVILGWGWSLWGSRFLRVCGVPVLILLYAAPIWDDFSFFFQALTVFANQILLNIANIPADIEEFYITIPSGAFVVAGGCSGVRYLMVALCLGTVYGNLFYTDARRTIALTVCAGVLSMVANWVRVFGIIVAGHVTEMESSLIDDHEAFGWVVFLIVTLVPLFFIARKFENTSTHEKPRPEIAERFELYNASSKRNCYAIVVSFLIPLAVPAVFILQTQIFVESDGAKLPVLPVASENWRGPLRFAAFWKPDYQNEDVDVNGIYVSDTLERVQLQITGYIKQEQGKELIYYTNRLYDAEKWNQLSMTTFQPELHQQNVEQVRETTLQSLDRKERIIIWSWYYLDGYQTPSVFKTKLIGGLHSLMGDRSGALIAVATRCNPGEDCQAQRSTIRNLLNTVTLRSSENRN